MTTESDRSIARSAVLDDGSKGLSDGSFALRHVKCIADRRKFHRESKLKYEQTDSEVQVKRVMEQAKQNPLRNTTNPQENPVHNRANPEEFHVKRNLTKANSSVNSETNRIQSAFYSDDGEGLLLTQPPTSARTNFSADMLYRTVNNVSLLDSNSTMGNEEAEMAQKVKSANIWMGNAKFPNQKVSLNFFPIDETIIQLNFT